MAIFHDFQAKKLLFMILKISLDGELLTEMEMLVSLA